MWSGTWATNDMAIWGFDNRISSGSGCRSEEYLRRHSYAAAKFIIRFVSLRICTWVYY